MTTASTRPRSRRSATAPRPSASAQERFDKRLSAKRRRMWKLVGVLVFLGAVAAGGWWALWRSDWLLVEQVVVTGPEARWEQQIRDAAGITMGQPLVQVDSSATEDAVRQVPIVADVQVVHSWPSTVTIEVSPREPVLAVHRTGHVALVDAEGVVIETVPEPPADLPAVVTEGAAGETEDAFRAAWGVLSSLPSSIEEQLTAASVTSAERVMLQLGERTVIWGGPEDSELKSQVAEALLGAGALRIDVSAPHSPVTEGTVEPSTEEDGS